MTREEQGIDILKRIIRYRRGEGKYNFSRGLSESDRELAAMEAWEEIENEILAYLHNSDKIEKENYEYERGNE